uniref:C2H2-type domain-containing protein n=1 Tax=Rhabditophanes sp. KR3021 TaxID=114890 RepID=A0AC35TKZ4_9BILA
MGIVVKCLHCKEDFTQGMLLNHILGDMLGHFLHRCSNCDQAFNDAALAQIHQIQNKHTVLMFADGINYTNHKIYMCAMQYYEACVEPNHLICPPPLKRGGEDELRGNLKEPVPSGSHILPKNKILSSLFELGVVDDKVEVVKHVGGSSSKGTSRQRNTTPDDWESARKIWGQRRSISSSKRSSELGKNERSAIHHKENDVKKSSKSPLDMSLKPPNRISDRHSIKHPILEKLHGSKSSSSSSVVSIAGKRANKMSKEVTQTTNILGRTNKRKSDFAPNHPFKQPTNEVTSEKTVGIPTLQFQIGAKNDLPTKVRARSGVNKGAIYVGEKTIGPKFTSTPMPRTGNLVNGEAELKTTRNGAIEKKDAPRSALRTSSVAPTRLPVNDVLSKAETKNAHSSYSSCFSSTGSLINGLLGERQHSKDILSNRSLFNSKLLSPPPQPIIKISSFPMIQIKKPVITASSKAPKPDIPKPLQPQILIEDPEKAVKTSAFEGTPAPAVKYYNEWTKY